MGNLSRISNAFRLHLFCFSPPLPLTHIQTQCATRCCVNNSPTNVVGWNDTYLSYHSFCGSGFWSWLRGCPGRLQSVSDRVGFHLGAQLETGLLLNTPACWQIQCREVVGLVLQFPASCRPEATLSSQRPPTASCHVGSPSVAAYNRASQGLRFQQDQRHSVKYGMAYP